MVGYFPKIDIFNEYDTVPEGLYVPCQIPCVPSTCNDQGICNELYGKPGETLCACSTGASGQKHVNESTFCTECDANWFPDRVEEEVGCTNFCVADLSDVGGEFPAICDEGDIDCVHCNGVGSCTVMEHANAGRIYGRLLSNAMHIAQRSHMRWSWSV